MPMIITCSRNSKSFLMMNTKTPFLSPAKAGFFYCLYFFLRQTDPGGRFYLQPAASFRFVFAVLVTFIVQPARLVLYLSSLGERNLRLILILFLLKKRLVDADNIHMRK